MDRFFVISGCSGGGKSSLLEELGKRGYATVPEPGRRIVAEEQMGKGLALPWVNLAAFARRAITLATHDFHHAQTLHGPVFFDRGLVDAVSALLHTTVAEDERHQALALCTDYRYHPTVFMVPPWPEIYENDAQRKHDLTSAMEEYDRLCAFYPSLGYELIELPRQSICDRADLIVAHVTAAIEKGPA